MSNYFKGTSGKWQFRRNGQQVIKILGTKTKKVCEINCNYNNRLDEVNFANALLISKAPEMLEELKETIVDLKILRNQIALESKNVHHWEGMPELIDEWINRKEQLIKQATEL